MMASLQRLKDAQRARQLANISGQRQQHLASTSDADNEAYMQQFEQAFSSLSASPGRLAAAQHAVDNSSVQAVSHQYPQGPTAVSTRFNSNSSHSSQRGRSWEGCTVSSGAFPASEQQSATALAGCSISLDPQTCRQGSEAVPAKRMAAAGWCTGPVNEAGVLVQLSERPLMCSAANWASNEVVVGSSDHASYVVDVATGKKRRTLYSKTTGHTEWVTCVCYLPGGRVLSGGMDGRLWLWPAAGSAGTEITSAHSAPVSKVACLTVQPAAEPRSGAAMHGSRGPSVGRSSVGTAAAASGPVLAASCSYDKTVKVWDVSGNRGREVAVLSGHAGPVLEMDADASNGIIVTGDRKGGLMCWDLASGSSSWGVTAAHQGHVTALTWQRDAAAPAPSHNDNSISSRCVISGGQDGCICVWDGRKGDCVVQREVHVDKKGKGAVGGIVTGCGSSGRLVVSAGADMTVGVLDPALSYKPIHTVKLIDFPYSLAAVGGVVVCGCGDGSVHVLDVDEGTTLYALGAGKAAIRALEVTKNKLVCAGDDGHVMVYDYC